MTLSWNPNREPGIAIGCIHGSCPTCGAVYDVELGHRTRRPECPPAVVASKSVSAPRRPGSASTLFDGVFPRDVPA